jgi:P-type Cu+ transporter
LIGGTQLLEGLLHVRVRGSTETSVLHQIVKLVESAQMQKAPIQQVADAIAGVFAVVVICAAVFVFALWTWLFAYQIVDDSDLPIKESHFVVAFTFAISTLVVACPCAMGEYCPPPPPPPPSSSPASLICRYHT